MADPYTAYGRIYRDTAECPGLLARGTLPGVSIDYAAPGNGPGLAAIEFDGAGSLRWRSPGSSDYGEWVEIVDGAATLLDEDSEGFVEVTTGDDYLPASAQAAVVELLDRYDPDGEGATDGDVEADDAETGTTRTYTLVFHNTGATQVALSAWLLEAGALEISADDVTYSSPTTQATGISLGNVAGSSTATLYVRETIAASSAADPRVLVGIVFGFLPDGDTETYLAIARGLYRVWNDPEYRFYRSSTTPPEEGDTPFATASSLPATPSDTFSDGTWYLAVSYFNGVLDSGFFPVGPAGEPYLTLMIASGEEVAAPPQTILQWRLEERAGGVVRVLAVYTEAGDGRADAWSIAYTTTGTDPTADSPDVTVDFLAASGAEILSYDLPAQSDGVEVRVLLQTRRNDGTEASPDWVYSDDATVLSIEVDTDGPGAPGSGLAWPGVAEGG